MLYCVGNVVDRNILMCMRIREIGCNFFFKIMWWKVDLGGWYSIYSINIIFKNYDGFSKVLI